MAGIRGGPTNAPYVASKHAVVGLTRCAALEGAPYGIRVNGIAPGHIDTRMARDLTAQLDPDDPGGAYERVAASVPLGRRYGTADEVANLVVWLLSDEASYVSGSTHLIDAAVNA
jgi:NAD(P)-dependent dehydrogenase (short-subunit alcohol dehydrogenase family)